MCRKSTVMDQSINQSTYINNFGFSQVTLAKANSAGSGLDSIIQQDILPGEGGVLEPGDAVEVKYTGWLLTDHKFGEVSYSYVIINFIS